MNGINELTGECDWFILKSDNIENAIHKGIVMNSRRIILLDMENFNGGPVATALQARWCRRMIENWIAIKPGEQVVIAADITTVTDIHQAWPEARILAGRNENGADLRLLEVMNESLPERFSDVVLVSGDRIFAEKISELAGQGLPTHVYAHAELLSKRLQFAATTTTTAINPSTALGKAA